MRRRPDDRQNADGVGHRRMNASSTSCRPRPGTTRFEFRGFATKPTTRRLPGSPLAPGLRSLPQPHLAPEPNHHRLRRQVPGPPLGSHPPARRLLRLAQRMGSLSRTLPEALGRPLGGEVGSVDPPIRGERRLALRPTIVIAPADRTTPRMSTFADASC